MAIRHYWLELVEKSWRERSVLWLSGVRRVGKTFLCQSLDNVEYFDCELPRVRRLLDDPESFLQSIGKKRIVLDEIHRLANPTQLLKIAADHFPKLRVLATGSSTLGASTKFRDTLTGRKRDIRLTPLTLPDLVDFARTGLPHRFLHGGLPPFFLAKELPERDFQDWTDAYWAKDIQELFRLERRSAFQKCFELMLAQSGGIFEATSFAGPCEVSRTTIGNYLGVLEATQVAHVLKPFSTRRATEIIAAPKVYGFDTGFVCYHRGWSTLRRDDMGLLWEHFVLNELQARRQGLAINYWRDKSRHELDFVLKPRGRPPIAIECKWTADQFDPGSLQVFRRLYPQGVNYLVAADVSRPTTRRYGQIEVRHVDLATLADAVAAAPSAVVDKPA